MSLYKRAGSDVWWATITINGERLRFSTEEYDRAAAQRIHDRRKANLHDQPKLKGRRWSDAVMKWAQAETRSDSDLLSLAKFGALYKDRLLSSVTAESIDTALRSFCVTDGTYNRYTTTLAAILRLSGARVKLTRRRNKNAKVRDWITPAQWQKLYAELPTHQKLMASFSIQTGLRQANVLGLTWDRVDLERRLVWVEAPDTKGNKAISVPLSKGAHALLSSIPGPHDGFVFTFRGKPIGEVKTAFQAACVRAGLGVIDPGTGLYRGFTWHGLRHTWATWHVQNGTPLEVLQKLGGWSDLRMVMNYAHHAPGFVASFADNATKGIK